MARDNDSNKTEFFGFRATPDLAVSLGKRAGEFGLNKSQVLRKACEEFCRNENFVDGHMLARELMDFRREFAPVGSNLNQLAKFFNEVSFVDSGDLRKTHEDLRDQFARLMKLLRTLDDELSGRYA